MSNFCSGIFWSRVTVAMVQTSALSCRDHQVSETLLARQGKSLGGLWSNACSVNFLESVAPAESLVPFVHKIVPAICLQLRVRQSISAFPYWYFAVLGCFSQKSPCERAEVSFGCLCPFTDLLPNALFKVGMTIGVFEGTFCSVNLGP